MGAIESTSLCSPVTATCQCVKGDRQYEFDDSKENPMPERSPILIEKFPEDISSSDRQTKVSNGSIVQIIEKLEQSFEEQLGGTNSRLSFQSDYYK
jgi:hypothetical protein